MPSLHNDGPSSTEENKILNVLKMLTAVLKFIADASLMQALYLGQENSLKFTLECVRFAISSLRKYCKKPLHFTEGDLRVTVLCIRSSFTYAAKFLSLLLKSSSNSSLSLPAPSNLANELLNVIASVEECLGYQHAARLLPAVKPWLPDLILALGYWHLLKQTPAESAYSIPSHSGTSTFPLWATVLAKIELYEFQDIGSDEETAPVSKSERSPAIKKLEEMIDQQLRVNFQVLDAVGVTFLNGSYLVWKARILISC